MNLIMIECAKCKTKFLTIVKCGKVTCPECGGTDEIKEITIRCTDQEGEQG